MGDLGMQVSIRSFVHLSVNIYHGHLVSETPLTVFFTNLFETLQMFSFGVRMCMWFGYNC